MQRKWSELIHRHNKQDEVTGSGNGHANGKATEELAEDPSENAAASFRIELLPMEDIYRARGDHESAARLQHQQGGRDGPQ